MYFADFDPASHASIFGSSNETLLLQMNESLQLFFEFQLLNVTVHEEILFGVALTYIDPGKGYFVYFPHS